MRRLASALYLLVGLAITAGAYGHGFVGRLGIDAELAKFAIARNVYTMLYVVWYFVSGCFLLFGLTIVWSWLRMRRGERHLLPMSYAVALLWIATGVGGMIYRDGDRFMLVFVVEGALLLASTALLARPERRIVA